MKDATSPRSTSNKRAGRRLIAIGLTLLLTSFFTTTAFAGQEKVPDPVATFTGCAIEITQAEGGLSLTDYTFPYWVTSGAYAPDPDGTVTSAPYVIDLSSYDGLTVKVKVKAPLVGDTGLGPDIFNERVTIDCMQEPTTGSLSVTKDVLGEYEGPEFAFAGTCTLPHLVAHETFTLADGETWTFEEDIPEYLDGSPCELKETGSNGADDVAYSLNGSPLTKDGDGKVHFELSSTEDLVITVTNTFREEDEFGSLSVTKTVVGEYEGPEFAFAGTCTLPHLVAHETFTLADGETWTFEEDIPEYLDGSPCELKETGSNGADSVTYSLNGSPLTKDGDGKVHFELSSTEDLVITVTNTFTTPGMARLQIVKDVVGPYSGPAFPFEGTCVAPQMMSAAATLTIPSLADNGTWTSAEWPIGTNCDVREASSNGASSVAYRLDGVAVPLTDGFVDVTLSAAKTYVLTVTNTFPTPTTTTTPPPPPPAVPDIELVKVADITPDLDGFKYVEYDEDEPLPTITYTYTVTNTGETTLTDLTLVDTPLGAVTLGSTSLPTGESTTGIALHALTPAEIAAGEVFNEATVTGTAPNGTQVTDDDDETVYVIEVQPEVILRSEIELEKEALIEPDENGEKVVEWTEGEDAPTVTYRYTITNTGETVLTGLVLVDDQLGTIELPEDGLAVGEELVVDYEHTVTTAERELGKIVNVATATANAPDGAEVTDTATETVLLIEVLPLIIEPAPVLPATGAGLSAMALIGGILLVMGAGSLAFERRRR